MCAILLVHIRTEVRACVVTPCGVSLFCNVNRRCPEDNFVPPRLLPSQPFEVLEHRPISFYYHLCVRGEVSAYPTLNRRDHLKSFLFVTDRGGSVRCDYALNIGKACGDLRAIQFGIESGFGVIAIDTTMKRDTAVLSLRLRKKARQFGDQLHVGKILAHLAQLIVYASEGDLLCLRGRSARFVPLPGEMERGVGTPDRTSIAHQQQKRPDPR
ncbi:MAG: hypothetical protein JWM43_1486 [Acidobacteriaceae bacterium]|nr:hypothetical protein [Acidobacteriaceae bacterium]